MRRKDEWSIYRIAMHLRRPYNTVKNEIARGTGQLYHGKVSRYKAKVGEQTYRENRRNSCRQYKRLEVSHFIKYVEDKFTGGWSLDACVGKALESRKDWANTLTRRILNYRTPEELFEAELDKIYAR